MGILVGCSNVKNVILKPSFLGVLLTAGNCAWVRQNAKNVFTDDKNYTIMFTILKQTHFNKFEVHNLNKNKIV